MSQRNNVRSSVPARGKPARGPDAGKSGSRSPKHRGYRADDAAAAPASGGKKARWSSEQRVAKGLASDRPRGERPGAATDRDSKRPDWTPRDKRATGRGAPARHSDRPNHFGDNRGHGSSRRDESSDRYGRPAQDDRRDRPVRDDRYGRPARDSWQGRPERPARDDRQRDTGAGRNDRAPRYDRAERPARRDDRSFDAPRENRSDRGGRDDRARHTSAPRYERDDRPRRDSGDRFDRDNRAPRTGRPTSADRPARGDYASRPRRDNDFRSDPRDDRSDSPRRGGSSRDFDRAAPRSFAEDVVHERLEAKPTSVADVDGLTFGDLGLGDNIVRALAELGASAPFPIQGATIPEVLAGRDVLGRGRTGSGKTIAFGAPLVERLLRTKPSASGTDRRSRGFGRKPRALILAPTRELALQLDRTVQPIARSVGLFTTQIYGGVPQGRQVGALQRGVDIIIGTPGRIEDLVDQRKLDLSEVEIVVLDEADHMCELGFLEPVQRIIRHTADGGQRMLFSATLDAGVTDLVTEFLVNPSVHEVAGETQDAGTIDHRVLLIDQRDKREIIEQLTSGEGKVLIFSRTRSFAEELADQLDDAGIAAVSLHGDLNQARRTRNLEKLTSGRVRVLVATDVAARGIHVDDIALVIQADPADDHKAYMHRSGRTGRAGRPGTVVTLVNSSRRRRMDELLQRAEITPVIDRVRPGDELLDELAAL